MKLKSVIFFSFLLVFSSALFFSCHENAVIPDDPPTPEEPEPEEPVIVEDTLKPRYLWFDASANFERFSHLDSVQFYLDKSKEAGISDIVVDVRPVCGDVLYKSDIVDELIDWKGYHRNIDWDYLETFISEGKQRGLRVHASLNVFSGGHNYFDAGIVYRDPEMGALTTLLNLPEGMTDIKTIKSKYAAFFDPTSPVVQDYCRSIIKEVVAKYPELNGIILDRCRFDDIDSDFSQGSKERFESYIGQQLNAFPDDIFKWIPLGGGNMGRHPGNFYTKWIEWRAKVIYDFFAKTRDEVKTINPEIKFGTYTGAWYPTYYFVGANWASQNYDPKTDNIENWLYTSKYKDFGYAALLDIYMTGVYYNTLYGNGWSTIEGGLANAKRITMGDVPVSGGLYAEMYKTAPDDFEKAVTLCLTDADGLMVFDIVQVIMYDLWDELKEGITKGLEEE